MKNNLFSDAFANKGNIYSPDEESEAYLIAASLRDFNKIIERLKLRYKSLPEIEVNFLDGDNLGAHARIYEEKYFIAIQKGSLKILMNTFMRMLSNPQIFEGLGNIGNEREIEKIDNAQIDNYLSFIYRDIELEIPNDPRRLKVAIEMLNRAMRQLFLHELAHLIRGHCAWLGVENNKTYCPPLIRQGMEIDADRYGMNLELNQLKSEDMISTQPDKDYVLQEKLFIWSFALATMLNLVPRMESAKDFKNANTPPFALRYKLMITEAVLVVFKDHSKIKDITQHLYGSLKRQEDAFSKIQTQVTYTHFAMSSSPEIVRHQEEIGIEWKQFEEELSEISFINLDYR